MAVTQRHESPDGLLVLLIDREGDDVMVGLEGFQWHTHADLLTPDYGPTQEEALANFVRDILEDKLTLAVTCTAGEIREVWVTDNPADEWKHVLEGQTVELRCWRGAAWKSV